MCAWGVGATLSRTAALQPDLAAGLADRRLCPAQLSAAIVALLISLPMWLFLPLLAWLKGTPIQLQPDWPVLLLGVILVNGITEEVIHRGFVFGHLQREHSFIRAATLSALLFAAQHLYLIFSIGWTAGLASVLLAALLTFPLAYSYRRGGNSLGGPAILHTSSNAPMIILALSPGFAASVLVLYMGVVLISIYLVFIVYQIPVIRIVSVSKRTAYNGKQSNN
ncbi:MAG: CPBP family intramembrane glutamic endopeptidase [Anaerolineae bacterium]